MNRKIFITLLVCLLALTSCSSANEYKLAYNSDGGSAVEYIYYTDAQVVYVVGGLMMCEIDGSSKMLEMALKDGDITIDDIIASADSYVKGKDIECTEYPDGSKEYHYDGFDIIKLNTYEGNHDIYFVPSSMSYYDVTN
ncbi:MAG: hypothetical protein J6Q89_01240 [Clostridia bacterium]|nr:hypothetical protein [Clostridia bacterium]